MGCLYFLLGSDQIQLVFAFVMEWKVLGFWLFVDGDRYLAIGVVVAHLKTVLLILVQIVGECSLQLF